jgi:hypothetical protein
MTEEKTAPSLDERIAALEPDEQKDFAKKMEAYAERILFKPAPTKEGNGHWHSAPVGPNGEQPMTLEQHAAAMAASHEAAKGVKPAWATKRWCGYP